MTLSLPPLGAERGDGGATTSSSYRPWGLVEGQGTRTETALQPARLSYIPAGDQSCTYQPASVEG